jgi:hypothetical protein
MSNFFAESSIGVSTYFCTIVACLRFKQYFIMSSKFDMHLMPRPLELWPGFMIQAL